MIGAGRVGRAVTAAIVTAGLVSSVLIYSRRRIEAVALATDVADLAATQHAPTRVDAVEHPRDLRSCAVLVVCSPSPHALHIRAGDVVVTMITTEPAVSNWLTSYLGSWWTVPKSHRSSATRCGAESANASSPSPIEVCY